MNDISIIIYNDEVVNLEDLVVELKSLTQIFPLEVGMKFRWPITADNNIIQIEGKRSVGYENSKLVRISDKQNDQLTIRLEKPLIWSSWVNPGGGTTDNAILEVELHVKGSIEGRTTYPIKVRGRLVYSRQPQVFELEEAGKTRKIDTIYSRLFWELPDEKK